MGCLLSGSKVKRFSRRVKLNFFCELRPMPLSASWDKRSCDYCSGWPRARHFPRTGL